MKLRPWAQVGGAIQPALDEIRSVLERFVLDSTVQIALVSGVEEQRQHEAGKKPIGFVPASAVDSTGKALTIAAWAFNADPRDARGAKRPGWYGVTVTFASGTSGIVTGRLVGA